MVDVLLESGGLLLRLGDVRGAERSLRRAYGLDPKALKCVEALAQCLDALGLCYFRSGRTEAALAYFDQANGLDARNAPYRMHRCLSNIKLERQVEALSDLNVYLELRPDDEDALILRARLHWNREAKRDANEDLMRAKKLNPRHPGVKAYESVLDKQGKQESISATVHIMRGEFNRAYSQLKNALHLNPENSNLLLLLSGVCRLLGFIDEGLLAVHRAKTQVKLRSQALSSGKPSREMAKAEVAELASLKVVSDKIHIQLVQLLNDQAVQLHEAGEEATALRVFDRALKLCSDRDITGPPVTPKNKFKLVLNRGDCLLSLNKLDLALDAYKHAERLAVSSATARTRQSIVQNSLGIELFNQANHDDAITRFTKAIDLDNQIGEYYANRGVAYKLLHRFYEAQDDFERAWIADPTNRKAQAWFSSQANHKFNRSKPIK